MDDLRADLRAFGRTLIRQRSLSAAVIGVLAAGIAASIVVYSLVDALVLDPFPYPESERLVAIGSEMPRAGRELGFFERLSGPEIEDVRERGHTLEHLLPFDLNSVRVRRAGHPLRLFALYTWADPFETLEVGPALGRGFTAAEALRGDGVAVISHELWQKHFGEDPDILGQSLVADGTAYTVVGVTPPASTIYTADLWLPLGESAATLPRERRHFNLLARIAPGADLEAVNADLEAVAAAVERDLGTDAAEPLDEYAGWRLAATTWTRLNAFAYEDEAVLALGAIVFVLLLVAANLANLLLTRAASRQGEAALRLALGASRRRIVRQALTESTLFAALGGAAGLVLASWSLDAVVAWLPAVLQPVAAPVAFDRTILIFAAAVTGLTALICGLAPALHLGRVELRAALTAGARASGDRSTRRVHRVLVVAQVALAVILLAGAGSLTVAWIEIAGRDPGFAAEGLVSMRLSLPRSDYPEEAVAPFFARLQEEVAALPGVERASIATQVAPDTVFTAEIELEGQAAGDANPRPLHTVVGDGYFDTLGLELVRGRALGPEDHAGGPCAMVINSAAGRFFPGVDPLGRRARVLGFRFDSGWCEIVGVVAGVRNQGPAKPPAAEVFTSHRQAGGRYNQMFLVVRALGDEPAALVASIRSLVQRLDPEQPIYAIGTADEALASQLAPRRVTAQLLAGFASTALLLAALGIYGVVAYGVAQRRPEMSLRLALGAVRRDLAGLVIRESLITVAIGLVLGAGGVLVLARLLRQQLAAVGELSPWLLVAPAGILTLAAVAAAAVPAWRAGGTTPGEILRRV